MSWNTVEIEIVSAKKSQVLLWRLPSLTWWLDLQIKYLGNKLLYDHVPDPFPWCRI